MDDFSIHSFRSDLSTPIDTSITPKGKQLEDHADLLALDTSQKILFSEMSPGKSFVQGTIHKELLGSPDLSHEPKAESIENMVKSSQTKGPNRALSSLVGMASKALSVAAKHFDKSIVVQIASGSAISIQLAKQGKYKLAGYLALTTATKGAAALFDKMVKQEKDLTALAKINATVLDIKG